MATATWYDVLGVPRDAGPDQIKAAWRQATDKFEPGTGSSSQFRMFNEAADVLLDPEQRAAYDASLPEQDRAEPERTHAGPDFIDPPHAAAEPEPEPETETEPTGREPSVRKPATRAAVLLSILLALLTVAAVVLVVVFGLKARTDSRVADARDEAPAAAERAAKVMLAYDYKQLPQDRKRAATYLTDGFAKKYLANFKLLEKQKDGTPGAAVQTKTSVTSSVLGSGVTDASEDRVRVLVFVNQVSTRPGKDPQIFQNRVAMTMQKVGNKWLVADLKSY
ncbi:MAG: heat shock protein DnaJ domain protein [Marmoricola sp.]|nr:heat shock protein DnaJ domain protein [Marmoricola sp.]